jgi:uncharacterized protein (DUF1697 family)
MQYLALLRGINVGGKNPVKMAELRLTFEELGFADVATYIQSGNVLFEAPENLAHRVPDLMARAVLERFGLRVPVVTRGSGELRQVARGNPFLSSGVNEAALHVVFLADRPSKARLAALDPARSPPDECIARGREIYLHLPNGVARTRFTNDYFDTRLETTSTMRNWKTLVKLIEMSSARSPR